MPIFKGISTVWIGLKQLDFASEPAGGWYWVFPDGSSELATSIPWVPGEPTNGLGQEHFANLKVVPGKINDAHFDLVLTHQLCQYGWHVSFISYFFILYLFVEGKVRWQAFT